MCVPGSLVSTADVVHLLPSFLLSFTLTTSLCLPLRWSPRFSKVSELLPDTIYTVHVFLPPHQLGVAAAAVSQEGVRMFVCAFLVFVLFGLFLTVVCLFICSLDSLFAR